MSDPIHNFRCRIYKKTDLEAFQNLKEHLDNNSNKYSDQATGLFAIRLANERLKQHKKVDKDIKDLM